MSISYLVKLATDRKVTIIFSVVELSFYVNLYIKRVEYFIIIYSFHEFIWT